MSSFLCICLSIWSYGQAAVSIFPSPSYLFIEDTSRNFRHWWSTHPMDKCFSFYSLFHHKYLTVQRTAYKDWSLWSLLTLLLPPRCFSLADTLTVLESPYTTLQICFLAKASPHTYSSWDFDLAIDHLIKESLLCLEGAMSSYLLFPPGTGLSERKRWCPDWGIHKGFSAVGCSQVSTSF